MSKHRGQTFAACAIAIVVAAACSSSSKSTSSGSTSPSSTGSSSSGSSVSGLPDVTQHFTGGGGLTASAPGITPTTIKLGYITSETGIAASSFKGGEAGAIARIDLQNAQGGVDGRKIVLVTADDGTIGPKAAAQQMVENQGVFGVIDLSAFVVGAAPYYQQEDVPVTGAGIDGPEWGQQPYTNMFSFGPATYTPFGGKYYTYDSVAMFLKSLGVTKLAAFSYGISESSIQSNKSTLQAAAAYGISNCYEDNSVGFGQVAFTTESLAVQRAGCNGIISTMVDASDVGFSAALKEAGVSAKQFYYTGYDQSVLDDSNASTALDGDYFSAAPDFTDPNAGTQGMLAAHPPVRAQRHRHSLARCLRVLLRSRRNDRGPGGCRGQPNPTVVHHQPAQRVELPRSWAFLPARAQFHRVRYPGDAAGTDVLGLCRAPGWEIRHCGQERVREARSD